MSNKDIIEKTSPPPLAISIQDSCRLTGLGRTTIYDLIRTGRLRSLTVGRRRLVLYESIIALLN